MVRAPRRREESPGVRRAHRIAAQMALRVWTSSYTLPSKLLLLVLPLPTPSPPPPPLRLPGLPPLPPPLLLYGEAPPAAPAGLTQLLRPPLPLPLAAGRPPPLLLAPLEWRPLAGASPPPVAPVAQAAAAHGAGSFPQNWLRLGFAAAIRWAQPITSNGLPGWPVSPAAAARRRRRAPAARGEGRARPCWAAARRRRGRAASRPGGCCGQCRQPTLPSYRPHSPGWDRGAELGRQRAPARPGVGPRNEDCAARSRTAAPPRHKKFWGIIEVF